MITVFNSLAFSEYPLLTRLSQLIETQRAKGELKLPTETFLCDHFGTDRYRLHQVLQTLSRDGLIYSQKNRGWFIQNKKNEIPVVRYNSYTRNMRDQNKRPRSEVLGIDLIQPTGVLLDFFTWMAGTKEQLWALDYKRFDQETPFSVSRIFLPASLTPGLNREVKASLSLYGILDAVYGIKPQRQKTSCEAVSCDSVIAQALDITIGTPLLKSTNLAVWKTQPFELAVNYLRSDLCRIVFDLDAVSEEQNFCPEENE